MEKSNGEDQGRNAEKASLSPPSPLDAVIAELIELGGQRRFAGEAAMAHGYAPARRAEAWVLADSMFRAQWAGDRDEDGVAPTKSSKPVAVQAHPLGPFGERYQRRRVYLAERSPDMSPAHAKAEATRYMFKGFLAQLRQAWRAAECSSA